MKFVGMWAAVAGFSALAPLDAALAQGVIFNPLRAPRQHCGGPQEGPIRQWERGRELKRQEALTTVRNIAYGRYAPVAEDPYRSAAYGRHASDAAPPHGTPELDALKCAVTELRSLYAARAGRQQTLLDVSSGGVLAGGIGNIVSAPAGATTQTYWGYAALLPVLAAEVNAHEPTRDIFHGGALALDLIAARYGDLQYSTNALRTAPGGLRRRGDKASGACQDLKTQLRLIADWPDRATREPIYNEAKRISDECDARGDWRADVDAIEGEIGNWDLHLVRLFAADVLALETALTARDHELRYTPFETFGRLAAAPFQLATTLLSGENGSKAVAALKTQNAFANLDLTLSDIPLPLAQPKPGERLVVSGEARAAAKDLKERGPAAIKVITSAVDALNAERDPFHHALGHGDRMRKAAASNQLKFNYDANTRRAMVSLTQPTPATVQVTPAGAR
jgi:hypothetical protein